MRSTTPPALSLIVAGAAALVFAFAGGTQAVTFVTLFGEAELTGPLGLSLEWLTRLRDIAATLGLSAAVCGALALRWPSRAVAAIVGVALVLATAFLLVWLINPVNGSETAASAITWEWTAYASVIALADAAISAFWLARAVPRQPQ